MNPSLVGVRVGVRSVATAWEGPTARPASIDAHKDVALPILQPNVMPSSGLSGYLEQNFVN